MTAPTQASEPLLQSPWLQHGSPAPPQATQSWVESQTDPALHGSGVPVQQASPRAPHGPHTWAGSQTNPALHGNVTPVQQGSPLAPHTSAAQVCVGLQTSGAGQVPHGSRVPQPPSMVPQVAPSWAQVMVTQPQTWAWPPAPHVSGAAQEPHET